MTKLLMVIFGLLLTSCLFSQFNEKNYLTYLESAFKNKDTISRELLLTDFHEYLTHYKDSPNVDRVLYLLGELYFQDEKYREAFSTFLKDQFLFPDSPLHPDLAGRLNQIILSKASRLFEDQQPELIRVITTPRKKMPTHETYYEYFTFLHNQKNKTLNKALIEEIAFYTHIYAGEAQHADELQWWLAHLNEQFEEWESSISNYSKLIGLFPKSQYVPESMYRIAYIQFYELSEYEHASKNFSKILDEFPRSEIAGDAEFQLASLYENKLDDEVQAIAKYRLLVETYPDNKHAVEALKRVAEIMDDNSNYEEAIASYYQIFELYPRSDFAPEALLEIESLYRRDLDNYEKAVEILKLFAGQYPQHEDAAEHLYDAAEMTEDDLKNKQAAIEIYHQVINSFPNSKYAEKSKDNIADLTGQE